MIERIVRFPSVSAMMIATSAIVVTSPLRADPKPVRAKAAALTVGQQSVVLEVRDTEPGRAAVVEKVSVPLGDRGTTKLESRTRGAQYNFKVARDGVDDPNTLMFDVQRLPRDAGPETSEIWARATVRVKPGQRVVIARIERSNGSRTEVLATLRH